MTIALLVCIIGGIVYILCAGRETTLAALSELGKYAFAIGLVFVLWKGI